jgi:hypothetical protein
VDEIVTRFQMNLMEDEVTAGILVNLFRHRVSAKRYDGQLIIVFIPNHRLNVLRTLEKTLWDRFVNTGWQIVDPNAVLCLALNSSMCVAECNTNEDNPLWRPPKNKQLVEHEE